MTRQRLEFDRISPELVVCHRYGTTVKAELFSTVLSTEAGVFLVDPISGSTEALDLFPREHRVVGILVTNENHVRASAEIAAELGAPIFAHDTAGVPGATPPERAKLGPDLEVIAVPGAPKGEFALHCSRDGGTLIIGDALINFGSHGFDFLPQKYCENAKLMRRSLRKLLDYQFERMLFAHGTPICVAAKARFTTLLENGP